MGRLVGAMSGLLAYACVATVIAAATGLVYWRASGRLDDAKLARLVAVLRGTELTPTAAESAPAPTAKDDEQPSYDDRMRTVALQQRQLEMREQAVKSVLAEVLDRQREFNEQRSRYDLIKEAFRKELADVRNGLKSSGRNNVVQTLTNVKPKQAKEQLMQMIKAQEMDEVVTILSLMPLDNRAKIVSEFKTAEEAKVLDDILRLIRQAKSENELVDRSERQIQQPQ